MLCCVHSGNLSEEPADHVQRVRDGLINIPGIDETVLLIKTDRFNILLFHAYFHMVIMCFPAKRIQDQRKRGRTVSFSLIAFIYRQRLMAEATSLQLSGSTDEGRAFSYLCYKQAC